MTRKCSHCSHNGHNSRTCPNRGVKIFGVRLTDGSGIRKSASMGNLSSHYTNGLSSTSNTTTTTPSNNHPFIGIGSSSSSNNLHNHHHPGSPGETPDHGHGHGSVDGYASEDFVQGSSSSCRERKKGVPWTEEEHRMFLLGLQKLGKGDWRGISRNYVISRTPTQVASHAQKYFIRQSNMSRRKRRSSLFDIIADESIDTAQVGSGEVIPISHPQAEVDSDNPMPDPPTAIDEEYESMDSTNSADREPVLPMPEFIEPTYPVIVPAYFSPFFPFSFPFWPGYTAAVVPERNHEVVKPLAVHSKSPINVDELVGMSKLSLGESHGQLGPSSLSVKSLEDSTRQSAFHANPVTDNTSSVNSSSSPIHAV